MAGKKTRIEIFQGIVERSKEVNFKSVDKQQGIGTTTKGYNVTLTNCSCPANRTPAGCVIVETAKGNTIEICKHVVSLAREFGIGGLPQLRDHVDGVQSEESIVFGKTAAPVKVKPQISFRFDRYRSVSWISMSYTTDETVKLINEYATERSLSVAIVQINGLTEVLLSHPDYTTPADSYGLQMRLAYALMDQGYKVTVTG